MRAVRFAVVVFALALPGIAVAQEVWDCVSQPCTFMTDPLPTTGTPPERCRLYSNGAPILEAPVARLGRGEAYCLLQAQFPGGTFLLWATSVSHDGAESPPSNVLNATMIGGVLPPPNAPRGFRRIW